MLWRDVERTAYADVARYRVGDWPFTLIRSQNRWWVGAINKDASSWLASQNLRNCQFKTRGQALDVLLAHLAGADEVLRIRQPARLRSTGVGRSYAAAGGYTVTWRNGRWNVALAGKLLYRSMTLRVAALLIASDRDVRELLNSRIPPRESVDAPFRGGVWHSGLEMAFKQGRDD